MLKGITIRFFKNDIFESIFSLINCLEELVITLKLNVTINKIKNISKVTKEYKEKLFKKLLENKETIESYGLLALYAPNSNVLEAFKLAGFKIEGELEFLLKLKQLKKNLDSLKKKLMFLQGKIGHLKDMLKNED